MEDILQTLGYLTLGSRLRRIGERLQASTQNYLASRDISVPVAQLPLLATLDRIGPLTVGELSQALRVAQPGVTRMVDKLQKAGLVQSNPDAGDQRIRRISLSAQGRQLVETSKHTVWPLIEAALQAQCAELSGSLIEQLAAFENALTHGDFESRLVHMQTPTEGKHDASA
jgi:DNA-binding MarR family transcriptional regulator